MTKFEVSYMGHNLLHQRTGIEDRGMPRSRKRAWTQKSSQVSFAMALYLASVLDRAIIGYLQETKNMHKPS